MSTEIGAKKQRNWLLDFLRIPAGFCIAINHFMQRWCDSLESVYEKGFVKGVFPQEFHYVSKYIQEPLKQFYRYQLISFQKPISGLSYVPTITPRSKNAFLSSQHVSGNKPHA